MIQNSLARLIALHTATPNKPDLLIKFWADHLSSGVGF